MKNNMSEKKGGIYIKTGKPINVTKVPTVILEQISKDTGTDFSLEVDSKGRVKATPQTYVVVPSDKTSNQEKK